MKKLIILAAIICAAIASQAASFNWKCSTGENIYLGNATDRAASMTAYLFDTDAYSQQDVITAFTSGSFSSLSTLSSVTTSSTGLVQTSAAGNGFDYGNVGDSLTAFFAVIADDQIFISTTASGVGQETGVTSLGFTGIKTPSQTAAMNASAGYKGAGWYTQSVPEPTSGLLLLLGMAGLALKRKQA